MFELLNCYWDPESPVTPVQKTEKRHSFQANLQ